MARSEGLAKTSRKRWQLHVSGSTAHTTVGASEQEGSLAA
jgi:hypothetical protein